MTSEIRIHKVFRDGVIHGMHVIGCRLVVGETINSAYHFYKKAVGAMKAGSDVPLAGWDDKSLDINEYIGEEKMTDFLYYEAHVTIDPPKNDEESNHIGSIAREYYFRVANLFMVKDGSPHTKDAFMTARHRDWGVIASRVKGVVSGLKANGYTVRRYKIEGTIVDSVIVDDFDIL